MSAPLDQAWAQVLAHPDDLEARQVLADSMQEAGDPHGELIELQLTAVDAAGLAVVRTREQEVLRQHAAALLGDAELLTRLELTWEAGFVKVAQAVASLRDAQTLFHAPAGRLVRSMHLTDLAIPVAQIATMLEHHAPATLRTLRVGMTLAGTPVVHDVAPLFRALPRLEALDVTGLLADFSAVTSAGLKALSVGSFLNAEPTLTTLAVAQLPGLRRLEVVLPETGAHFPGSFLAAHGFPAVERLSLLGHVTRQNIEALAGSVLLARLRSLTIVPAFRNGWDEALRAHATAYAHLERIQIVDTIDPVAAKVELADVLPNVVVTGEKKPKVG